MAWAEGTEVSELPIGLLVKVRLHKTMNDRGWYFYVRDHEKIQYADAVLFNQDGVFAINPRVTK